MRNNYIKFCDKHGIRDGVLRELLIKGKEEEAEKEVQASIDQRRLEIIVLEELQRIMGENNGGR